MFFLKAVFLLVLCGSLVAQTHRNCPLGCNCDFENGFKRVRCEVQDSSININFNNLDSDVQFLEVLPRERGRTDAFGPSIPDAFQGFTKLTRLIIRNNGIQRIPANTARQLSQLDTLDLAGNEIQSFRDLSLESLTNVESLQLSNNKFDSIDGDSLRSLKNLRSLGLDNNNIARISDDAFLSQQLLEHLSLRNNRLADIPSGIFDSISRLQELHLDGNQFNAVPRGAQRLLGLTTLSLDNNKIATIPSSLVQAWRASEALVTVSLQQNPLQCDGSLADFVSWIKSSDGSKKVCSGTSGQRCPVCDGPSSAAGRPIDSVNVGSSNQGKDQLTARPGSGTDDYAIFQVVDSVSVPSNFNPRREAQRPPSSTVTDQMSEKLQRFMPDAGVRCGQQSCYYFSAKGTSEWRTAEFICQNIGLDLVEIGSAVEQEELMRLLVESVKENPSRQSKSRGWHTGMKYSPKDRSAISAATGRPISFSNWAQGQPNSQATSESCIELWDTADWNDGRCSLPLESQFICESPLAVGQGLAQRARTDRVPSSGSGGRRVSGSSNSGSSGSFSGSGSVSFTVVSSARS